MGDILRKHGSLFHLYTDDVNIYLVFEPSNFSSTMEKMECMIADVRSWLKCNMLGFNDEKTDFIVINGPRRKPLEIRPLKVGDADIPPSESVKALGVHLDNTLGMSKQINEVTKSSFYKLSNMYKM